MDKEVKQLLHELIDDMAQAVYTNSKKETKEFKQEIIRILERY